MTAISSGLRCASEGAPSASRFGRASAPREFIQFTITVSNLSSEPLADGLQLFRARSIPKQQEQCGATDNWKLKAESCPLLSIGSFCAMFAVVMPVPAQQFDRHTMQMIPIMKRRQNLVRRGFRLLSFSWSLRMESLNCLIPCFIRQLGRLPLNRFLDL
jgi:hypothetical protein